MAAKKSDHYSNQSKTMTITAWLVGEIWPWLSLPDQWEKSDHDSNSSQIMTLTACQVGFINLYSTSSQTMTLKSFLPGNSNWAFGPSLPGYLQYPATQPTTWILTLPSIWNVRRPSICVNTACVQILSTLLWVGQNPYLWRTQNSSKIGISKFMVLN